MDLEDIKTKIEALKSSEDAFVVFSTESDRDEAVDAVEGKGIQYKDNTLQLSVKICEPDTIQWENFGNTSMMLRFFRLIQGFGCILLALLVWTCVFYAPYAYQVMTFNFDNGAQPPFTLAMTFCMVVVLGNAIMYEVCARVSDYIGFKTRDDRESCYLILYVIACMFNVILDMVTTYFMCVRILDGLNFRTYYGVRFSKLPTPSVEEFETYAMQRMLAENTKAYAFPATFLIPFLIEPFITVIGPYYLGVLMVSTHSEWIGRDAELWMQAIPFDMGRYGDLLLDMVLGNLIFFFPGGYTLWLFCGMAGSHAYIYFFDHARVLRTIPKCVYATIDVDWWANWMMGPITGMILSCLIFKGNCRPKYDGYCFHNINGAALIEAMWGVFFLHTILHTLLLYYFIPLFNPNATDMNADVTYEQASKKFACTWFTSNPIHCLRSKLLKEEGEGKYCTFNVLGKEYLHNYNPKIGCHWKSEKPEGEEFDFSKTLRSFSHTSKSDTKSGE